MKDTQEEQEDKQEMYEHYHFDVDKGQAIIRIDKYLTDRIENISRNKVQTAAAAGNVLVNEKAVKSNYKIKPHDAISIVMTYPKREVEIIAENIPLNIVYEDDDLIVINKQVGLVVHPGHGNYTGTLVNALTYHLKDLPLFNSGEVRPGLVHRLDKNTSGIMVVAKTEIALNKLAKQFFDRTVDRRYVAMIWGNMEEEEGMITGHIGRSLKDRTVRSVFPEGDFGKHAVTHYKVLESLGYVSLVECKLETGRTHQIRVHMQYIKHPLFNDETYGGDRILKGTTFTKYKQFVQNCFKMLPRHALHAKTLSFTHPTTGERMSFDSELADDMLQTIDKWKQYTATRNE